MLIGGISKFLSDDIRAIAGEQRGYRRLSFCVGTFHQFQVVVTITVGPIMHERGIGAEAILKDVEPNRLGEHAMPRHTRVAGDAHHFLCRLIGDDIDNACYGITTRDMLIRFRSTLFEMSPDSF